MDSKHIFEHSWQEVVVNENLDSYWTEERIKNAEPVPLPEVSPESILEHDWNADQPIQMIESDSVPVSDASPIPNTQIWPYTTIGKIYGDWIDQNNGLHHAQGSCWIIGGTGNRLVITAGHSLFDFYGYLWPAKTWLHNFAFVGCDNSVMPIVKIAAHTGWARDGKFQYDIGAAVLARGLVNSGNLAAAFNVPPQQSGPWRNIGYPGGGPMAQASGPYAGGGGEGRQIAMSNNDLGDGASGGPWLLNNFQGQPNVVNGLLSTRGGGTPYDAVPLCGSPYFGQQILAFINWAKANML